MKAVFRCSWKYVIYEVFTWQRYVLCVKCESTYACTHVKALRRAKIPKHMCIHPQKNTHTHTHTNAYTHAHAHIHTTFQNPIKLGLWDLSATCQMALSVCTSSTVWDSWQQDYGHEQCICGSARCWHIISTVEESKCVLRRVTACVIWSKKGTTGKRLFSHASLMCEWFVCLYAPGWMNRPVCRSQGFLWVRLKRCDCRCM